MEKGGKYLKAIVENGSFSKAAKALYVSQPYLSKLVKKLEEELGVNLINRDETPITLTYAGERYISYMDEMEQTYRNMKYEIEAITNLKKGRLKLGVNPILASHTLYNVLPRFILMYPGIKIDLIETSAKEIETLLLQRKIDICINMLPIFNPDIMYENLYEDRLLTVIPPGFKLYHNDQQEISTLPTNIQELNGEKFILLKQEHGLRRATDELLKKYAIQPEIVLETSNVENAYRLATKGIGITFVPECIVSNTLFQDTKPNLYTIDNPPYKFNVVVAYKKGETLSAPALAFLNLAKEEYKSLK